MREATNTSYSEMLAVTVVTAVAVFCQTSETERAVRYLRVPRTRLELTAGGSGRYSVGAEALAGATCPYG